MPKGVLFFKNALVGKKVGAIARSSKYVISQVSKNIDDLKLETIVEYGPGDGVLTIELLKKLRTNGKMLVVENDENFIKSLKKINDSRLTIIKGKMEDVSKNLATYGFGNCDLIISSVPFSLIPKKDREEMVKKSCDSITQDGKFIIFHQYSFLMERMLEKYFRNVMTDFEPRNILPCFIMTAWK